MLTIADAKRGDIGSTMAAYADAWLRDGSPLAADAVTLSPYLGFESLRPALDLAAATGRGVFVLALTSNPEGARVQHVGGAESVARRIAESAAAENAAAGGAGRAGLGGPGGRRDGRADGHGRLGLDLAAVNGPHPGAGPRRPGRHRRPTSRRTFGAAVRQCPGAPPAGTSSRPVRTPRRPARGGRANPGGLAALRLSRSSRRARSGRRPIAAGVRSRSGAVLVSSVHAQMCPPGPLVRRAGLSGGACESCDR